VRLHGFEFLEVFYLGVQCLKTCDQTHAGKITLVFKKGDEPCGEISMFKGDNYYIYTPAPI
jgi:hypothetical protein